jgi:Domain of unknown function (DUF5671)
MNSELYSFVKESLERGIDRQTIRSTLLHARWQEAEVQNALAAFADIDFPVPVPRPRPYLQAREAFLYIVSFIALYITAFSVGTLVFSFIDRAFPDPLRTGESFPTETLTIALAAIIVAFPIYLFLMWRIVKAAVQNPEQRHSVIPKWLTYLTLVVGAGIIIGDLIALLANFLGGELTIRFTLKAFTILTITGAIFGYYLWDLQREEKSEP